MTIRRARRTTSLFAAFLLSGSLAALLILSGCSSPTPQSSVAAVSASEATLAAAGRVVLACYSVPRCASVAPKPAIKSAYDAAYTSVTQAQSVADSGGTPSMVETTAAIAALQALVVQLPQP